MTGEFIAVAYFYLLGWAGLRLFLPQTGMRFIMPAAMLAGMSLWVFISVLLIVSGISFDPVYPTIIGAVIAIIINHRWATGFSKSEIVSGVGGMLILILISAMLIPLDLATFGSDALWDLYIADELIFRGHFSDGTRLLWLAKVPYFLPIISTASAALGISHFSSLQPLIGCCGLVLFWVLAQRALHTKTTSKLISWGLPIVAIVALASTPSIRMHAFAFKTHGLVMVHMVIAGAALYIASKEKSIQWFSIALVFASTLVWMRPETGVVGLPILVVAAGAKYVPLRLRLLCVGGVSVMWACWYVYLTIVTIYFDGLVYGQIYIPLVLVGMVPGLFGVLLLVGYAFSANSKNMQFIERGLALLPRFMIATIVIALIVVTGGNLQNSTSNFYQMFCPLITPSSGTFGIGTALILCAISALVFTGSQPDARPVKYIVLAFVLLLPLAFSDLTFVAICTNLLAPARTLSHILPLAIFYFMLILGAVSTRAQTTEN